MKEGSGGKRPGPVPKPPRRARGPYQTLNLQGNLERLQVATGIALDPVGESASKVWKPLAKSGKNGERVGESGRPDLLDGFAAGSGDRLDHVDDVGRLVVATSEPLWREERAVRLD